MKKFLAFCCVAVFVCGIAAAQVKQGSNAWISVKTVDVKASTGFFAGSKGTLAYGAQVSVLQVSGKWAEVRSTGNRPVQGWVAVSNLSARRIVAQGAASGISADEMALAGKGFNEEIEDAYRAEEGAKVDYADVDKTEAITVPSSQLQKFITDGHLNAGGQ